MVSKVHVRRVTFTICRPWSVLILMVALGMASAAARGAPDPLGVVRSDVTGVRFQVEGLQAKWTAQMTAAGRETRHVLGIPGFLTTGEPGHTALPRRGGWVVVPPGTRPRVVTVSESWSDAAGQLIAIEPVPILIRGSEPGDTEAGSFLLLPDEDVPADLPVPESVLPSLASRGSARTGGAVNLGPVRWWRGRRIVSYELVPVRHDAEGRALAVLRSGTWEIRFEPDTTTDDIPGAHARKSRAGGDEHFGGIFLNENLLRTQPTEAAVRGAVTPERDDGRAKSYGGKKGALLGPEVRLGSWRTGLVRVTHARLSERGFLPSGTIQEDQIRLYQRRYLSRLDDGSGQRPYAEIEVPLHMVGEGDGFEGDDFFVFYGLRLRDDGAFVADVGAGPEDIPGCADEAEWNNEANVYWLAVSEPDAGSPWARMATSTLSAAAGVPAARYRRDDHYEEQLFFREYTPTRTTDRLYYNFFKDQVGSAGIAPLWSPDPAGADVEVTVSYSGFSNSRRDRRLELITDETRTTELGVVAITTMTAASQTFNVPASAIDGVNAKVRMSPADGANVLFTYLDWVKISYDALYRAVNNRLEFHGGDVTGLRDLEVTGLGDPDVGLVEITDPRRPVFVELDGTNVLSDGQAWKLSVAVDQAAGRRTFALQGDFGGVGVPEFPYHLSSVADDPQDPTRLSGGDPDLIVITHEEFEPALGRWLEHRQRRAGGDLDIHVVDVQDLYDWYGGGLRAEWALKRFVTHAITRWNSWALTIVGDANENALERGVISGARGWSTDWVPTHYHVQRALSFPPELMATDKWYTSLSSMGEGEQDDFPHDVFTPWEMYTGRLPCNSITELDNMIDKIMAVENVQAGQDWRRRGIFMADDAWSNGYGAQALTELVYSPGELVFARSERDSLAVMWEGATGVTLEDDLILLETYLDPLHPYEPPNPPNRPLRTLQEDAALHATGPLLATLNRGGLVAHYQGHANPSVLTSEYWLDDSPIGGRRRDVSLMANNDMPWFFMGLGCHIADWAQNTHSSSTAFKEPSMSEKMLVRARSGASATYASSGYEYISENKLFGEYIFRRWTRHPPRGGLNADPTNRSRWVAGELMWASEADILAIRRDRLVQEMMSQYVLLGDPLMGLDAGEPVVTATLLGTPDQEISGEAELVALDETNLRTVTIEARDEAGIDRIEVTDSDGVDLTDMVVTESLPPGATTDQVVNFSLAVPMRPFDHSLTVKVFDTGGALATDRHYTLVLNQSQDAVFTTGGEVIDPETYVFPLDIPVRFTTQVSSPAWLNDAMPKSLTSETLEIQNVVFTIGKSLDMTVDFVATAHGPEPVDEHKVILEIDGHPTEWILQQGTETGSSAAIGRVYNYPNPMSDRTRFVFESGADGGKGFIRVFSSAGRPVARIGFTYGGGGPGVVDWDGRDDAGDLMANGTYLYRVEMDTDQGSVASGMQRLVMMR